MAGAEDADRLVGSDRVKAYIRERLRLQWALLWLAASARGEAWTPPTPEALALEPDAADAAAAGELVGEAGAFDVEPLSLSLPAPAAPPAEPVADETGMVEI